MCDDWCLLTTYLEIEYFINFFAKVPVFCGKKLSLGTFGKLNIRMCHEATFGTSRTTCSCCSHAADLYLSLLIKVTDLAYTECHAMRDYSVVLLHRC